MTLEMIMWITDCVTHVAMIFAIAWVWTAIINSEEE
jgi:hypothetical protein